ncbi:MAG TPA: GNAT family N-acetyltransferase, partial [Brevundimonas sp.]|nr:GNAT family N-acetyltransferase [Brevundimonas sp.]
MTLDHPLDRPIWSALTGRQAPLALGDRRALRFDPAFALFAAAADGSGESLAALGALNTSPNGLGMIEAGDPPVPPGAVVRSKAAGVQMVATALKGGGKAVAFEPLGESDAAEMLALATLTVPGPFFEKTHRLGDFVGVKVDGRL